MRKFTSVIALMLLLIIFVCCQPVSAFTPSEFEVTAQSAMLVNADSGDVIYEKNIDSRQYVGSVSNLMTAIIVCEKISDIDGTLVTVKKELLDYFLGSGAAMSHFENGQQCTVRRLLEFLLVSSGSDAALILADFVSGNEAEFVKLMNQKAKQLGMTGTAYSVPHGLFDSDQYSTARDTMTLIKAAFKHKAILEICSMPRFTADGNSIYGERTVPTTNYLINKYSDHYYKYAVAGKTGNTDSGGRSIACLAQKEGVSYYCVLLGSPQKVNGQAVRNDLRESKQLFNWAFDSFSFKTVVSQGEPIVGVDKSGKTVGGVEVDISWQTDYMQLYAKQTRIALMPNDADRSSVVYSIELKHEVFDAPIKSGDVLGKASIMYGGHKVGEVDLVAADSADRSITLLVLRAFRRLFDNAIARVILFAMVVCVIAVIIVLIYSSRAKRRRIELNRYKRL